jgi:hypothetical protein
VSADLVQKVDMLDQKFEVKGRYLKAPQQRTYLRLAVTGLADGEGTVLQVCDGQVLWEYKKILEGQTYSKIEVGKILELLKSPDLEPGIRDRVGSQLGFSGPEDLLVGLRSTVKFDQKESGTLDGHDVWVFRGEWRNRNAILGQRQQSPVAPTAAIPAYYPSLVVLYVDKENGWPYKLTLVGRKPSMLLEKSKSAGEARRQASQEVQPTRIELIYSNVVLNPSLKIDEFAFQAPPGANVDDQTAPIVQFLEQAIAYQVAQKKAEAAKSEVPVLNEGVEVPRPSAKPGVPKIPDNLSPGTSGAPPK